MDQTFKALKHICHTAIKEGDIFTLKELREAAPNVDIAWLIRAEAITPMETPLIVQKVPSEELEKEIEELNNIVGKLTESNSKLIEENKKLRGQIGEAARMVERLQGEAEERKKADEQRAKDVADLLPLATETPPPEPQQPQGENSQQPPQTQPPQKPPQQPQGNKRK